MKSNYEKLGKYIREIDNRNAGDIKENLLGVSTRKVFIESIANTIGTDFTTYRLIKRGQFAYVPDTSRRGDKIGVALLDHVDEGMISQAYTVFEVTDENSLLPEYLMMWFRRPEFDRYARYMSYGSVREIFSWEDMCDLELPVPHIDKQREIVAEYNTIINRIDLNNKLIQKLEETAQAIYKQWFVDFEFPNENGEPYKSAGGEMEYNQKLDKEIPSGWNVQSLLNTSSYLNRGVTPTYIESGGIVVVNQRCIRDGSIDFTFSKRHNASKKKIDNERYLQQFDILVNSTGEGTLGRVGLVKEVHSQVIVDTHITIVRSSDIVRPLYLWFSVSSKADDIANLGEGSTGQTELSRDNLGKLQILVPPDSIQEKFSKIVAPVIAHSSKIEQEIPVLESTRNILLSKLATVEN